MSDEPLISVVIPVWRDASALARTLGRLNAPDDVEVIVATAFDDEANFCAERGDFPRVRWTSASRGRGVQMNAGAAIARGRWIVFLHADSELPGEWHTVIATLELQRDVAAGAFRLALESESRWARLIEAGVRLRVAVLGPPYGDRKNGVVVGPATDGGYYLIGMNRPHPSLFERIDWSASRVLSQTLASASAAGLDVVLLEPWTDVDDAVSLRRVVAESSALTASRTRAWWLEHMADCQGTSQVLRRRTENPKGDTYALG